MLKYNGKLRFVVALFFLLLFCAILFGNNAYASPYIVNKTLIVNISIDSDGKTNYDYYGEYNSILPLDGKIPAYNLDMYKFWEVSKRYQNLTNFENDGFDYGRLENDSFKVISPTKRTLSAKIYGTVYDVSLEPTTQTYIFHRYFRFQESEGIRQDLTINVFLPYALVPLKEDYYISLIGYNHNILGKPDYDNTLSVKGPSISSNESKNINTINNLTISYNKINDNIEDVEFNITFFYQISPKEPLLSGYQVDTIDFKERNYEINNFQIINRYNRTLEYAHSPSIPKLSQSFYIWDTALNKKPNISFKSGIVLGNGFVTELINSGSDHKLNKQEIKRCDGILSKIGYPFQCIIIEMNRQIIPTISDNLFFQFNHELVFQKTKLKINKEKSDILIMPSEVTVKPFIFFNEVLEDELTLKIPQKRYYYPLKIQYPISDTSYIYHPVMWIQPTISFSDDRILINNINIIGPYSKLNSQFKVVLEPPKFFAYFISLLMFVVFSILGYYECRKYRHTHNQKQKKILMAICGLFLFYILDFIFLRDYLEIYSVSLFDFLPILGIIAGIICFKIKS